jgi:lipoic acid synthetase
MVDGPATSPGRQRAFRVDAAPDAALFARVRDARARGAVPDVILGDVLVGDGPREALDPVDVTPDELRQLVDGARLPRWVVEKGSFGPGYVQLKSLMRQESLVTVCEEASCPNIQRCWTRGTATFMIAGETCTRGCRFCDVTSGKPMLPPDPREPERLADAAASMGLRYVVVTAVARDDQPDGGAGHFAAVIRALRDRLPDARVEVLIPDFRGNWDALDQVIDARPDVLNHNTETVPRLYKRVRPGARYERTLELLERSRASGLPTKSGIMVGLGEHLPEVAQVFSDLAASGCEVVTVGQYLSPSPGHLPVERFYAPSEYPALAALGESRGLAHVEAGPLVRSSFEADRVADEVGAGVV